MLIPITAMARPINVKNGPDYNILHDRWIKVNTRAAGWAETSWPGVKVRTEVYFRDGSSASSTGNNYSRTKDISGPGHIFSTYANMGLVPWR